MELSDANLQTLTEYLKKTLDPDPTIRRPGKNKCCLGLVYSFCAVCQLVQFDSSRGGCTWSVMDSLWCVIDFLVKYFFLFGGSPRRAAGPGARCGAWMS